jgi:peptidoglycan LD-endopeptidase LytH
VRPHAPARLAVAAAVALLGVALAGSPAWAGHADDLDALTEEREAVAHDLDAVVADLERTSVRLADTRAEHERLGAELRELLVRAEEADARLGDRAVLAYVRRGAHPLGLLLGSERSSAVQRSRLLEGLGRRERALVEHAERARLAYRQRRDRLATLAERLAGEEERLAEARAGLDEAFHDARRREQELASRRDRQRRVSRSGQQGVYACPVAEPFHFRDSWGEPRSGGRRHRGVDIFGPMGADVYAFTDGTVVRHSRSRLGGIGLYLAGDDGNQYYYAHLKEILDGYGPGTRVEAGELMALNGATGNASPDAPHVHFEVRPGGGAHVNPYPYTAAACWG